MAVRAGRRIVGSALLLALPVLLVALLLVPAVRTPLTRTVATIGSDLFGSSGGDLRFEVAATDRVRAGHPVFLASAPGGLRPVAWVTDVAEGSLAVRFAPGADAAGRWRLLALPAARGLGDAWEVAVPEATARDLGRRLSARLGTVLEEAILPEIKARLPAFLARIDPRQDAKAREVLDAVGREVMARLQPFVDDVVSHVTGDLESHFDWLERVGLLWKLVRGDGRGLGRELLPVAQKSAKTWWDEHRDAVLTAVGEGVAAKAPDLQAWLTSDVFDAAKEELAQPTLEAQRARLEDEAEDAIGDVLRAVVEAPEGGFRTRFAAVLRSRLLEKDEPLLLLERVP